VQGYPDIYGEGAEGDSLSNVGSFSKRWGWYHLFYTLAHGDATRFEAISGLNVHFAFTHASYEKQKADVERRELEKLTKK
jgi:hypothetical protein